MSITRCPICDCEYDQDTDVEHEEVCREEANEKAVKNLNKLNKVVGFYSRYPIYK